MKVAICIPYHRTAEGLFVDSLGKLLIHAGKAAVVRGGRREPLELEMLSASSSDIAGNRERIAERALDIGAEWLFWLDTDQVFPPDALARLIERDLPVVGCNYARRGDPTSPTAGIYEKGVEVPVWTDEDKARKGVVEQAHYMGLGVCLMRADVLHSIERPWFKPPHEDVHFFGKLLGTGLRFFVDHALSWQIGHVAARTLTNADTIRDKVR